jgi:hypothetical protein
VLLAESCCCAVCVGEVRGPDAAAAVADAAAAPRGGRACAAALAAAARCNRALQHLPGRSKQRGTYIHTMLVATAHTDLG